MTAGEFAERVLQARSALRQWDGKSSARVLATTIRGILAPLATAKLSVGAHGKLEEIHQILDAVTGSRLAPRQRDALDTLLLGLWIRVELTEQPSS